MSEVCVKLATLTLPANTLVADVPGRITACPSYDDVDLFMQSAPCTDERTTYWLLEFEKISCEFDDVDEPAP